MLPFIRGMLGNIFRSLAIKAAVFYFLLFSGVFILQRMLSPFGRRLSRASYIHFARQQYRSDSHGTEFG